MQTCQEGITSTQKSMKPKSQKKAKVFSQMARELTAAIKFCSRIDSKQHSIQCLASKMSCRRYFFLLLASPNAYANKNKYTSQFVVKKASIICKKKKKKCAPYLPSDCSDSGTSSSSREIKWKQMGQTLHNGEKLAFWRTRAQEEHSKLKTRPLQPRPKLGYWRKVYHFFCTCSYTKTNMAA